MARLTRTRLTLVLGAVAVLGAMGAGIALARPADTPATAPVSTPAVEAPVARPARAAARQERRQRVVHLEATVRLPAGGFATIAVDRGVVTSVDEGSIGIQPATGSVVTISTDDRTRVRRGWQPATLADVAVGSQVVVRSRLEDGSFVARRIVLAAPEPVASPAP